jgi:integrase
VRAKSVPSFTDVVIRSLPEGLHFDTRLAGFGMRVGKRRRTWVVVHGPTRTKRTKITIGHYPELSLHDARIKAKSVLGSPMAAVSGIAFADAVKLFLDQPRWRPSSKRVLESSLRHFAWRRSIDKISHEDVASALDAIEGRSARAHALKDIRTFFNWCVPRYLERSPCEGLRMEPQPSRDRVLSDDEIKRVWNAATTMGYPFGTIVQLLLLTGQRKMEIGSLTWDQVGKDQLSLPASVTKNGRAHVVPLPPAAVALLPARGTGSVFRATDSEDPYNGFTFHLRKLQAESETTDWTLHDLRRTVATNLAALGVPIHVTEKILNHVSGSLSGVAAIYNLT